MKKSITLLLAVLLCFSLVACSGGSQQKETKDEMLSVAKPLTREVLEKSIGNVAFAKTLIGNTYTFLGEIVSVKEDYAVITFYISGEQGNYSTAASVMVANLYLSSDELVSLENQQRLSFVGKLEEVSTHDETFSDFGTLTVIDMIFKNVAVVSDRFEKTGILDSPNVSYGNNSWNIKFPDSDYLGLVYFADDVSSYKGKEITYSYKVTSEGCVDAYIIE